MRSLLVVVSTTGLELFASILEQDKPVSVQAFVVRLAIEPPDERVVCGLVSPEEIQDHAAPERLKIHVARDKLATFANPDRLRITDLATSLF